MLEGKKRKANKKKGDIGESLAAKFLMGLGFEILKRNFATSIGEIDIVAIDKQTLVFVEVKSRKDCEFGHPAEAVNHHKIRKLSQVASQYIVKHRLFYTEVRFDVIEIYGDNEQINHIKNAFDSYLSF